MKWLGGNGLVIVGIVVHLILTYSVIDIHFQTPVVHGIDPVEVTHPGPAKRLFLIVADGLRADKLFEFDDSGTPRAPFLYEQGTKHGHYGIAHTRPPTESRPGHVAICAGFYEDPSALFSGWKVNPVKFDSVFNRTKVAWGLGAPDVVPIFEGHGNYVFDAYPPEMEDFSAADLSELDTWVFNKTDYILNDALRDPQHPLAVGPAIVFLHLLGLDSNGHAHGGPSSPKYLDNIRIVDDGIRNLTMLVDGVFPDGKSAYIFTADHGMTEQASHGDGAPENTETPLVVWGPGFGHKKISNFSGSGLEDWGYGGKDRIDIEQAQIAPLMSGVLGIPTPVNALLPVPAKLLNTTDASFTAHSVQNSAEQLLAAYDTKSSAIKASSVRFKPYKPLEDQRDELRGKIGAALGAGDFREAIQVGSELANLSVEGLTYLQKYDWVLLMVVVTLGFLGWIAFLATTLLTQFCDENLGHHKFGSHFRNRGGKNWEGGFLGLGLIALCVSWGILWWISAPKTYFLYFALPCVFIAMAAVQVCRSWHILVELGSQLPVVKVLGGALMTVLILLGISAGFDIRETFFVITAFAGLARSMQQLQRFRMAIFLPFLLSGSFALIPTVKKENSPVLVAASGVIGACGALLVLTGPWTDTRSKKSIGNVLKFQIFSMFCMAGLVLLPTHKSSVPGLSDSLVLGFTPLQLVFWVLFVGSPVLPVLSPPMLRERLTSVFVGLLSSFMVIGISWEPLFLCVMGWAMCSWAAMDTVDGPKDNGKENRPRSVLPQDIPNAVLFILFVNLGFFGQGNAASVASFDISSVYRLTHTFNPFVMGGILFVKNLVPLVLVSCVYSALLVRKRVALRSAHTLVVLLSDVMSVRFFFSVKGTGSWQEIGTSLGFYGVMNAQVIVVLVLFAISRGLTWDIGVGQLGQGGKAKGT